MWYVFWVALICSIGLSIVDAGINPDLEGCWVSRVAQSFTAYIIPLIICTLVIHIASHIQIGWKN